MSFPLLDEWLPANSDPERPQMILSTVSGNGIPDARTVLLTELDSEGLYFHTDSRSRKVADIAGNPAVALTFLWPGFTRQLVVQGRAEVASASELAAAFEARSPYLKQLAWQYSSKFAQLDRDERLSQWAAFKLPAEAPATWIGFLVRPPHLTFWGSNQDAASRREEFTLVDGDWMSSYLPG